MELLKKTENVTLSNGTIVPVHGMYIEDWQDAMAAFSRMVEILAVNMPDEEITDKIIEDYLPITFVEMSTGNAVEVLYEFLKYFMDITREMIEKCTLEDFDLLWKETVKLNRRPFTLKRNQMKSLGVLERAKTLDLQTLISFLQSKEQDSTQQSEDQLQLTLPSE